MSGTESKPPGRPGIAPRWTSSANDGVGAAVSHTSRIWFAISHGIVNEVYFPTFDIANTRDFGLLVTDGSAFFSEEKRDTVSSVETVAPGVPGFVLRNRCKQDRFEIEKTVISDPNGDALVQRVRFQALQGDRRDYHVHALLAPHIGNQGAHNTGWTGEYKGIPMLFAQRGPITMALACSTGFLGTNCGYVGASDTWQDLSLHKAMNWNYRRADDGNIALGAELDLRESGEAVLALGFGSTAAEAGLRARTALLRSFDGMLEQYSREWQVVQSGFDDLDGVSGSPTHLYRTSMAVLATLRSKQLSGGMIASLSIPWGAAKGDGDLGGYHLVWPRDLVESASALLAAGDQEAASQSLMFLMATQEADGHWPQNMWMDGMPYWSGVQMDETAFPILLADQLRRAHAPAAADAWPMVRAAARYVLRNGPVTQEDRWEEDGGFSPFTLAVEIAALLAAADFADEADEERAAAHLRETADIWNGCIERWTYVTGTPLAESSGVEGYYVRIAAPEAAEAGSPASGFVPIKNRPPGDSQALASHIVSPDALALVRFGLRAASDPRIRDTVTVVDRLLLADTATGPAWHRYVGDGYGEHDDGAGFDGTGRGRAWPLLAGERAHYELANGNLDEARRLLHVMEAQTSLGGLIPEQIWDAEDIPAFELKNGHPSGSAMPLAWAHAEYVKLLRSMKDGSVFDTPPQAQLRYLRSGVSRVVVPWRFNLRCTRIVPGSRLRVEVATAAVVHWSGDDWRTAEDVQTVDGGLDMHYADLPTENLAEGTSVTFTFLWLGPGTWEGQNFRVSIGEAAGEQTTAKS